MGSSGDFEGSSRWPFVGSPGSDCSAITFEMSSQRFEVGVVHELGVG